MASNDGSTAPIVEGARARARKEIRAAILASAGTQLAADGAAALSLRAVARDLGMASSAMYRYFDSRDALLTALIIDAFDSIGDHLERDIAASRDQPPATRWVNAAVAVREWALAHPHDYALVFGTPIPGYAAPEDTIGPGTRVPRLLVTIVQDAARDGAITPPTSPSALSPTTAASFDAIRAEIELDETVSNETFLITMTAWTQMFGLLTFELFGQTRNLVADDGVLYADAALAMARHVGLGER